MKGAGERIALARPSILARWCEPHKPLVPSLEWKPALVSANATLHEFTRELNLFLH